VGIDGLGGSGKTTFGEVLKSRISDCTVIQLDDFYSPISKSADILRLKEQVLLPFSKRKEAGFQIYDWRTGTLSDWKILQPKGVILLEGVYALHKDIRNYYDIKIWIEYPAEWGFQRGVLRDIQGDGVDNSDKWKSDWMPAEARYKRDQMPERSADFIVDGSDVGR